MRLGVVQPDLRYGDRRCDELRGRWRDRHLCAAYEVDAELLHQLRVARVFGAEHVAERLGRRSARAVGSQLIHLRLHFSEIHGAVHIGMDAADERYRCAGRSEHPVPARHGVARHAGFGYRRQVRQ